MTAGRRGTVEAGRAVRRVLAKAVVEADKAMKRGWHGSKADPQGRVEARRAVRLI